MIGDQLDEVWRALADPTRRRLLDLLRDAPRTTTDLCQPFGLSRFAIMKHLGVLEAAGLVLVRRAGRERWNYLNAVPIRQVYERWVSQYAGRWAASLLSLKRSVEGLEEERNLANDANSYRVVEVMLELTLASPPERVYDAFTQEIDQWWSFRGAPGSKMRLELSAGGRFYEEHPAQGYCFLWGTVLESRRPARLRVVDPYGSIRPGLAGEFRAEFAPAGAGTSVTLTQYFVGDVDGQALDCTQAGWRTLLDKQLRAWVERGDVCAHEAC